jgi:hypothetical protein
MTLNDSELLNVAIGLAIEASDYRPKRANNILEKLRAEPPRAALIDLITECQEICAPHQSDIIATTKPCLHDQHLVILTTVYV